MSEAPRALSELTPQQKRALLAQLLRDQPKQERLVPASYAQSTLWFLDQLTPGRAVYNMHAPVHVEGPLDQAVLERVLGEIVRRHESLRTTFRAVDGEPFLAIAPALPVPLSVVDLRALPESERQGQARRLATQEARRPFDLSKGPLFRVKLIRLGDEESVALLTLHHINADGWSTQIFFRELIALYEAFSQGRPSPLPVLPIQYADYAAWQRRRIEEGRANDSIAYWKQQLSGVAPLALPTDRPRPAVQTVRGGSRPFRFPTELGEQVHALSRRMQVTPFMTLLAAFQTLLHRYTGQDDLAIGSPYANRTRPELEGLIGYFVNMLVLRADLSGDPSFAELLIRTRQRVLEAISHQDLPFNKVVEELKLPRDSSRHPLFQAMFVLQNTPKTDISNSALKFKLKRQPTEGGRGAAKFELTLAMSDAKRGLKGRVQYNADLFDAATIDRMVDHFQRLLEAVVADPTRRLSELPLLSDSEREHLLTTWSSPRSMDPSAVCVHRQFETQAAQSPEAVAVVLLEQRWTYRTLNRRANQLARHLRSLGVGPEVPVGLLVERSPGLIVALLAILKAGGAYIPIDPAQPQERIKSIVGDLTGGVLLTQESLRGRVASDDAQVFCLDTDWATVADLPEENLDDGPTAANLAYILYTSGTTGQPKGVMIEHRALTHYNQAACQEYGISAADRVLQFASIGFDASAEEIFPCLTSGGALVLRSDTMLDSYAGFLRDCREYGITVASLPTVYWHELVAAISKERLEIPPTLRLLIIGGEAALPARVTEWQRCVGRSPRLLNTYGPTETTVVATTCDLTGWQPATTANVPIGTALPNVRVYVLDPQQRPVPIGIPGELAIGGSGLARGYWRSPALTAQRFVPDPFSKQPSERLYRTGDLVRWQADGSLEYLGRVDAQVKIRGHRIEPGEVEAALIGHPRVGDVAVLACEDAPGDRRLVAYVVAVDGAQLVPNELRGFLRNRVPEPMVPSAFIQLDRLPRTSSGKLDRQALPASTLETTGDEASFLAPATETEVKLAAIWSELLGRDRVGREESFFDLGGHSLLAIRLGARIRDVFQVELPLQRFFLVPTIAALADLIENAGQGFEHESADTAGIDLEAETNLDPKIQPTQSALPTGFNPDPSSVLLTGATGFLGRHLLHDLLRETRAEVLCLVRSQDEESGAGRLRSALEAHGLWDDAFASRIVAVPGDLSRPQLGLTDARFQVISTRVEVIYHNSASVNTLHPYEMLRATNVLGTQDILRLAVTGRTKPVHYVSTISVLKSITRSDPEVERIHETDPLGPGAILGGGYARSKWVAEHLMISARSRGIPVNIYRPERISGHSRTGACNTNDLMFLMLDNVRRTGSVPSLKGQVSFVPVDYVSQSIVALSRRPESRGRTFHLVNPAPLALPKLVEIIQGLGIPIRPVSPEVWQEELRDLAGRTHGTGSATAALALRAPAHRTSSRRPRVTIDCRNTLEGLAGTGISCPPIDTELLATYYSYFTRSGLLDGA